MGTEPKQHTSSNENKNLESDVLGTVPNADKKNPTHETKQRTNKIEVLKEIREWLTLFFAMVAVYFTYQIMYETRRQAEASVVAVNVANNALKFQQQSDSLNRIAQDRRDFINRRSQKMRDSIGLTGFRVDNRAYVVLAIDNPYEFLFKPDKKMYSKVFVGNFGKTPAFDYIHLNNYMIMTEFNQGWMDELFAMVDRHKNFGITIGSGNILSKESQWEAIVHVRDSIRVADNEVSIYFYGVIGYHDIFHIWHHTWYCLKYIGDKEGFSFLPEERFTGMD